MLVIRGRDDIQQLAINKGKQCCPMAFEVLRLGDINERDLIWRNTNVCSFRLSLFSLAFVFACFWPGQLDSLRLSLDCLLAIRDVFLLW